MENYESIIEPKKVYSQVYSILQLLGNSYINKIPKKIYKLIDSQRDKDYNPKYNLEISFIEQNVNKRALAIICMIDLKYWCNEEEKHLITEKLKQNQLIQNKKNEELYNNIFKKSIQNNKKNENIIEESNKLIVIEKNGFFKKIINIILRFFRKSN